MITSTYCSKSVDAVHCGSIRVIKNRQQKNCKKILETVAVLLVFLRFVFFVFLIKQQKMPMKRLDYGFRKPNPYYIVQKHLINFFQPQCMNEHCWFVQTNHCTASSFASLRISIKSAYTKCGVSGTAKSNCRVLTNRRRRGRKVDEIENCNFLIQPANFRQRKL